MPATAEQCRRYRARLKRRARRLVNGPGPIRCKSCERRQRLELAHIKPTGLSGPGRGLTARYLDVLAHQDCYALLCRTCHLRMDYPTAQEHFCYEA